MVENVDIPTEEKVTRELVGIGALAAVSRVDCHGDDICM